MAKTVVAIGTIGLGGCIVLSLAMREALETQQQIQASPLHKVLQREFHKRLVATSDDRNRARRRWRPARRRLRVIASLRKLPIAKAAGRLAWAHQPEGEGRAVPSAGRGCR